MCVLIAAPAGSEIPEEHLRHSNTRNKHGIGVAWIEDGRIRMWKNVNHERIDAAVKVVSRLKDFPKLVHFRYATHGTISRRNCHPFFVDDDRQVAVAHNGVLPIRQAELQGMALYLKDGWQFDGTLVREMAKNMKVFDLGKQDSRSDTRLFADHVIGNLDHTQFWWRDADALKDVEKMIGHDRMALLTMADGIVLLNKDNFILDGGVWYSNEMYKPYRYSVTSYNKSSQEKLLSKDEEQYEAFLEARGWKLASDRQRKLLTAADKEITRSVPLPVDGFRPLDDDDFLIGYFVQIDHTRKGVAVCVKCCPKRPSEDVACGLFNSDLMHTLSEACDSCKKPLETVAEELWKERIVVKDAINAVVGEETYDDNCMVCGYDQKACNCSVSELASGKRKVRALPDPSDEHIEDLIESESKPVGVTMTAANSSRADSLAALARNTHGELGVSQERLQIIVRNIRERGDDPEKISLMVAVEKYPDLFMTPESVGV